MKMKQYASFDEYFADQSPANQEILRGLRALVKHTTPALTESVKWGNGCWIVGGAPVAFVYSRTEYVEFGFFRATALADPDALLEGKGAYVRHIKMRSPKDAARTGVAKLLRAAADLTGRLAAAARGPAAKKGERRSAAGARKSAARKPAARKATGAAKPSAKAASRRAATPAKKRLK